MNGVQGKTLRLDELGNKTSLLIIRDMLISVQCEWRGALEAARSRAGCRDRTNTSSGNDHGPPASMQNPQPTVCRRGHMGSTFILEGNKYKGPFLGSDQ